MFPDQGCWECGTHKLSNATRSSARHAPVDGPLLDECIGGKDAPFGQRRATAWRFSSCMMRDAVDVGRPPSSAQRLNCCCCCKFKSCRWVAADSLVHASRLPKITCSHCLSARTFHSPFSDAKSNLMHRCTQRFSLVLDIRSDNFHGAEIRRGEESQKSNPRRHRRCVTRHASITSFAIFVDLLLTHLSVIVRSSFSTSERLLFPKRVP